MSEREHPRGRGKLLLQLLTQFCDVFFSLGRTMTLNQNRMGVHMYWWRRKKSLTFECVGSFECSHSLQSRVFFFIRFTRERERENFCGVFQHCSLDRKSMSMKFPWLWENKIKSAGGWRKEEKKVRKQKWKCGFSNSMLLNDFFHLMYFESFLLYLGDRKNF